MAWQDIKPGDTLTFEGINHMVPNPDRRWWQFWKPQMIDTGEGVIFVTQPLPAPPTSAGEG
jgi:hypothetical protein